MFINYRQEYVYNNKAHSSMKILPFKANYRQERRGDIKEQKSL